MHLTRENSAQSLRRTCRRSAESGQTTLRPQTQQVLRLSVLIGSTQLPRATLYSKQGLLKFFARVREDSTLWSTHYNGCQNLAWAWDLEKVKWTCKLWLAWSKTG